MTFKELLKKGSMLVVTMLLIAIPVISGICTKERAVNLFESIVGWACMGDGIILAVLAIIRSRKK